MPARTPHLAAAALLALCGVAATASAQHALDRNTQVGGGSVNNATRPSIADEVRFRNAIITGNAPGGYSFQGNVGYRAPGEFQGTLGSNDLYSFRRDSFYSGLAGQGIRGTDALQYQFSLTTGNRPAPGSDSGLSGFNGIYSRSGAGVTSGQVNLPETTTRGAAGYGGAPRRGEALDEGGLPLLSLRSPSAFIANRTLQPTVLGTVPSATGEATSSLSASVLRGISLDTEQPWSNPEQATTPPPINPVAGALPTKPAPDETQPRPANALSQPASSGAVQTAVPDQRQDTRISTSAAAPSPYQQLLDRLNGQAGTTGETGATGPSGATGSTGNLPDWQRRLEEVRQQLKEPSRPREGFPGATGATGPSGASGASGDAGVPGASGATGASGSRADRSALPDDTAARDRPRNSDVFSPETLRILRNGVTDVNTLSLPAFDAYGVNMQAAQQNLASGRFFDAEERFIAALSARPGDPMAAVGRVHAEMGAGMFLSAAVNLRALLTDHPELVGAKYAPELLPSKDRIARIIQRLTELSTGQEGNGRDAAVLLAYLAHQSGDDAAEQKGLQIMSTPAPGGGPDQLTRLATLMREVWGKPRETGKLVPAPPK